MCLVYSRFVSFVVLPVTGNKRSRESDDGAAGADPSKAQKTDAGQQATGASAANAQAGGEGEGAAPGSRGPSDPGTGGVWRMPATMQDQVRRAMHNRRSFVGRCEPLTHLTCVSLRRLV